MTPGATPLREVRLYGHLGRRFGRVHELAVDTPAEALRALASQHEGFRDALAGHDYTILVGDGKRPKDRDETELALPLGSASLVRIVPVAQGAKKGWFRVILGAVILASTFFFQMPLIVGKIGLGLVLGGTIQLLSPQQKAGSATEKETSFAFNGVVNTDAPGGPVPLIIGRLVVGSVRVSGGISSDEYSSGSVTLPTAPTLPGWMPLNPLAVEAA